MPILYCSVFNGSELLYLEPNQKVSKVVKEINPKLKKDDLRMTLSVNKEKTINLQRYKDSESQEFHTIYCLNTVDVPERIIWNFIEKVKESYEIGNLTSNILKDLIHDFNDPNIDQIYVLQEKIKEVKEIMIMNIDKLIERGEKLEEIVSITEEINVSAGEFLSGTKKVKGSMIKRFIIYFIILIFLIIGILLVIFFIACGFPYFDRCFYNKK